jgi:hypothetical protein
MISISPSPSSSSLLFDPSFFTSTQISPRKDIPSRTTVTNEIYTQSLECKSAIKQLFAECNSEVHLTFDAGTSKATDPYFTVTASFIKDTGDDWEPITTVIAFRKIDGSHNGINFGNLLFEIVTEYGLECKVRYLILQ